MQESRSITFEYRENHCGIAVANAGYMIAICLAVYAFLGLVFIGSLAFAAGRPTPQQLNIHPSENAIATPFNEEESSMRHAA